ncbi:hypothetical protein Nisw_08235 [Candidatus Nitrosopumilus sp. SW]|uniref:hypothetical protein n=1 Tax=Candidatus Nitrosopumilus sp. SW TaxID=2508726 RepID=UPI00114D811B|nr:hypothetical protein [Candidatus Nitrosopumilus sp. SW]QDI89511.1 hypothetical protein Nisw_08235 [Candidatus Nitrosopumilus sp. SW]
MGFSCKGVCEDFRGESIPNGSRYNYGQKRCSLCSLFLTVPSVRCPCCGAVLRTNPRGKRR